jgi:hypothetical protein
MSKKRFSSSIVPEAYAKTKISPQKKSKSFIDIYLNNSKKEKKKKSTETSYNNSYNITIINNIDEESANDRILNN